ncbi:XRE family transcriptional regulator [Subtercola sp. PAMC28395]|uniref:helix-turn-helix domain-containing protein n=1 Tax=Subtercola sp. PAMC28395 TaxID=2846775 RepID=UPI001C0B0CAF|nr:XRE family transcriptional regulator [Subtercola sp. PAMC28395]QWT22818.1 XRE family transcriptional regulator [Subtercola sp. PAMC28395]
MPINSVILSSRIAEARTEAGLTQADLAGQIGLARSAVAKIETGLRGVSALELSQIASAVGQRVEWLLTDGPAAVVAHRIRRDADSSVASIDRELERLARDVEFLAEQSSSFHLPAREPWSVPQSFSDADNLAARARDELNLEKGAPALRLAETFGGLGLLVFVKDLGIDSADGGTVLLSQGGLSLINGTSHLGRRRLTAAHELAHYLVADDFVIDWRVAEGAESGRTEAFFDRFARALLLPEEGLGRYWLTALADGLRAAAVRTASHFQVDMATLARRLHETGIIDREEAGRIREVRTTRADIVDYDLIVPYELEKPTLPRSYERGVLALYRGERISAERALDLLHSTYALEDLPELSPAREDELWSILN